MRTSTGNELPVAPSRYPLRDTLARLAPHAPRDLITADAWAAAIRHVGALPAALTTWMYFETRLHDGDPRVDVILAVDDVGRSILAGENTRHTVPASLLAHPVWSRIASFCRAYGPGMPLADVVDHIWLEFDVTAGSNADVPVPGVFISFGEFPRDVDTRSAAWARARLALESLLGRRPDPAVEERLERVFTSLPPYGYIPYFGVFFGRNEELVRVCINGVSPDELSPMLHELEWKGSLESLAPYAEPFAQLWRVSPRPVLGMLHLDVGVHGSSRLGVEFQLKRSSQLGGRLGNAALVRRFVDEGLCDRTRAIALGQWCGHTLEHLPHQLWRSRLVRWVNHLKLVIDDDRTVLKGYLCAFHSAAPAGQPRAPLWTRRRTAGLTTVS